MSTVGWIQAYIRQRRDAAALFRGGILDAASSGVMQEATQHQTGEASSSAASSVYGTQSGSSSTNSSNNLTCTVGLNGLL